MAAFASLTTLSAEPDISPLHFQSEMERRDFIAELSINQQNKLILPSFSIPMGYRDGEGRCAKDGCLPD
jgi:hypothetical protein